MKSRTANRRLYQIRRSRKIASYFYTTVGWTHSIKTAHIIQYVGTSKHFVGGVCILSEIFSKNRFNIGSKTLHDIVQTCKENRTEVVETGIVPK